MLCLSRIMTEALRGYGDVLLLKASEGSEGSILRAMSMLEHL